MTALTPQNPQLQTTGKKARLVDGDLVLQVARSGNRLRADARRGDKRGFVDLRAGCDPADRKPLKAVLAGDQQAAQQLAKNLLGP
jgi:hypothetical protein